MCGRFTDQLKSSKLSKKLRLGGKKIPDSQPRYNIAPSQPVRTQIGDSIDLLTWGLVPSWAKDPAIGHKMINARAETVGEKPSFRGPFKNSRCLVLADGFYEWKKEVQGKQPYYIKLKDEDEIMTFAGLWSHWTGSDGSEIKSCTIITTEPNGMMAEIHNRMPVILTGDARAQWMDSALHDKVKLQSLLKAYPAEEMEAYPVSTWVNDPHHDTADCLKAL